MPFAKFMASPVGRIARIVIGLALIIVGILAGGPMLALVAVGLVFVAVGVANVCLIGPIIRAPFKGSDVTR
ncbi:MAG: YgaP-like transmembrane domain [Dehalococcoidia bacterium]